MTLYINGKFLCQQKTGTQIYALSMLKAMKQQNIHFQILAPKTAHMNTSFDIKKCGFFSNLNLWEQLSLPFYLFRKKNSLLLNFCNSAPLLLNSQIVTIHDLAFEQKNQNWFSPVFKQWYRFLIPRICKKAKRVFTVSQFSKEELCRFYNLSVSKVDVIPNVLPEINALAERCIKEDYLLVIGAENPRKNADWLIQHVQVFSTYGLKLVMLSSDSTAFAKANRKQDPSVIYLNYVSDTEYYSLIKHAKALMYLSSYEGFGIPVLESLSIKTPVICNDLKVFKESFSELPLYISLKDDLSLKKSLEQLQTKNITEEDVENLRSKYNYTHSGSLIAQSLNSLI